MKSDPPGDTKQSAAAPNRPIVHRSMREIPAGRVDIPAVEQDRLIGAVTLSKIYDGGW
jgi:hypothetical protein